MITVNEWGVRPSALCRQCTMRHADERRMSLIFQWGEYLPGGKRVHRLWLCADHAGQLASALMEAL